jgi:hypothetical protein
MQLFCEIVENTYAERRASYENANNVANAQSVLWCAVLKLDLPSQIAAMEISNTQAQHTRSSNVV